MLSMQVIRENEIAFVHIKWNQVLFVGLNKQCKCFPIILYCNAF